MKKLVLGVAFLAIGLTPALADLGPSPSDAHPPGALFKSTPRGSATSDPRGNMINPPIDMRVRTSPQMRSSNVGLITPSRRLHRRHRAAPSR